MQKLLSQIDAKIIIGAAVLLLWFALILVGQATTPAGSSFIAALKEILYGLAGWHAVTNLQPSAAGAMPVQSITLGGVAEQAAPAVIGAVEAISPAASEVVSVAQKAAPVVEAVAQAVEAAPSPAAEPAVPEVHA
jgi:hypothetical protein